MLFKKSAILASLAISSTLLAIPVASTAASLMIANHTPAATTSKINGFICSDILPMHGTTPAGAEDTIPAEMVHAMCPASSGNCTAVVYEGPHCNNNGGYEIATIVLNENSGVVSSYKSSTFPLDAPKGGFKITLG